MLFPSGTAVPCAGGVARRKGTVDVRRMGRAIAMRGALAVAWAGACGGGLAGLTRYQATPGTPAAARDWPAGTRVARGGEFTLVVVVHPRCPCSRATVDNLAVLMAHCPPGRVAATVVFVRPAGVPVGWERTGLWASAAAIPGVTTFADDGGVEAARFGAATSGQAMLFDAAGRLRFRGGLTPGRGHAGDCGGTDAVRAIARGDRPDADPTPVFGCPLGDGPFPAVAASTACRPGGI